MTVVSVEAFQQLDVFFAKALASMMLLLIFNVPDHRAELRMGVGKRTETFLPGESARNPVAIIDESGRSSLNVANQIRERNVRSLTDEDMKMIRHVVDGD